jgi:hypothetical protein
MPSTYKVLGQIHPPAATTQSLYTVPAATQAVASTLVVCNMSSGSAATVRVAVQPAGASILDQHYIVYDSTINANDSLFLTIGLALGATDIVSARASTADVSFSLFGSEIT